MNSPIISIIVAHGANREIGAENDLLWHIPEDLKRFKELTIGHPVVMGRKTYESIPKKFRPLPNRTNIIITRNETYDAPGSFVVHSLNDALTKAREVDNEEVFIIGGASIYDQALPLADRLYVTEVHEEFPEADTFFPDYSEFTNIINEKKSSDNNSSYTFKTLEK